MTASPSTLQPAKGQGELSFARLVAYALPALPVAAYQLPFVIIVPKFYADNVGLSLGIIGVLILVTRLIDACLDPFTGYYADHSRPKWGRRRVWFGLAAIPTTIGAVLVFNPFPGVDTSNNLFWGAYFLISSIIMSLGYTALSLSHLSWGAESSGSYDGRTRVFAAREVTTVLGTLVATGLPYVLTKLGYVGDGPVLIALSVMVGVFLPLFTLLAVLSVPEPRHTNHPPTPFIEGLRGMRDNAPFKRLLLAFSISNFANGVPATLLLYYVRDYVHGNEETQRLFLFLYFLCGMLSTPIWLWVSKKTSKHRAWSIAMLIACFGFIWAPFIGWETLGENSVWAFGAIMILSGFAVGADFMLPPSIQADVIDVDTAKSGEQHSGFYYAIWALATKIALAIALGMGFIILGLVGFKKGEQTDAAAQVVQQVVKEGEVAAGLAVPPKAERKGVKVHATEVKPVKQTPLALWTLALLYAWLPVAMKLIAVALVWNFPIGASEQARLRAEIEKKLANGQASH